LPNSVQIAARSTRSSRNCAAPFAVSNPG
jgi:hypothetical protein